MIFGKILVPLDGSPTAEHVLPLARALATGLEARIELISVIDLGELAHNVSAAENLFLDTLAEDEARCRRDYLAEVAKSFSQLTVHWRVARGKAENSIIDAAAVENNALIAMATHGRSGMNRWLLGSVAEKILRGTSNPLLLVRASEKGPSAEHCTLRSIVVPLDGSPLAETVLPAVVDLARKLKLEVVLLRVFHLPYGVYDGGGYGVDWERLIAGVESSVQQYLEEKRAALETAGLEKVSIALKQGMSADEIIEFGRKSPEALIAMCSHGRSGVKRWVLGSVAETVARHAANPVLIFRATV